MSTLESFSPQHRPTSRARVRPEPVVRRVVRRDVEGNELGEVELEPRLFGIEPNPAVLHQVVTAQLAAARAGTHSTRTRAEVRGGGAKPYRQKGTGRARQGSLRAPQFAGGGIAMGPKPRSYRQRTPKKMVHLALCSALSDRAGSERVALVDHFGWSEPKTKSASATLAALAITGRVLVVLAPEDWVAARSFANLPDVQTTSVSDLAAHDVVRSDWVLFTDQSLAHLVRGPERQGSPAGEDDTQIVVEVRDEDAGEVAVSEEIVDGEDARVVAELQEVEIEEEEA